MNIHIRTGKPRNNQCGDWLRDRHDAIHIVVSDMPLKSAVAVAIHELIEMLLCEEASISDQQVTEFDAQFEQERAKGQRRKSDEAGNSPKCPYYFQHQRATHTERAVVEALGTSFTWDQHVKNVESSLSQPRP